MKRFSAGGFLAALFAWLALAAAWTPFPAQAQVLAGHSIVASLSRATDPCPGAAVCAKFTGAQGYKAGGQITRNFASLPGLTVTRSTGGYAEAVDGSLVWFPPASPRITGKGLLVEQASTNLLLQSQALNVSPWSLTAATVGVGAATAPDGTSTGVALIETSASSNHAFNQTLTKAATATTYTLSAYVKAGGQGWATLFMSNGAVSNYARQFFNLQSCTLGTVQSVAFTGITATATPIAGGWCKLSLTATSDTDTALVIRIEAGSANGTVVYAGTNGATSLYAWGAQLEALAFPTSYTPTTSASATRAADVITLAQASPSALTLVAKYSTFNPLTNTTAVSFDDATSNNRVQLGATGTTGQFAYGAAAGGVNEFFSTATGVSPATTPIIAAFRAAPNSASIFANGSSVFSSSTFSVPTATTLALGVDRLRSVALNGYLQYVALYPAGLSDAQLSALTSGTDLTSLSLDFARGLYKTTTPYVRTNLLLQSQAFDSTNWTKVSASVSADQTTAPDGTPTADLITPSSSTSGLVKQTLTVNGSTTYAFSIYLKQGTSTQSRLLFRDETNSLNVLQATAITWAGGVPTIGGVTAGTWIGPVSAGNGWWRIGGFAPTGAGGVSASVQVFPDSLNGTGTVYAWGGQVE